LLEIRPYSTDSEDYSVPLYPKLQEYEGKDTDNAGRYCGSPHLDGQYTVFGEVEEGLDVVEMIQGTATGCADRPIDDIEMRMLLVE